MFQIVEELCESNGTNGKIVLRSTPDTPGPLAITELRSGEAKKAALTHATKLGLTSPGTSDGVNIYPIDADGNVVADTTKTPVAQWQAEVAVTARLV